VRIEAQSYLLDWYGAFGFVPRGPEYLEDGIPHTPIVLT
jgi:ElaA protein